MYTDEFGNPLVKKPFWEILVDECVVHLHSPEFREEFFALIRNDEIYIRLYVMHLWLIADRLKQSNVQF